MLHERRTPIESLRGKSVAVVGNSPCLFEQDYGQAIDSHDHVIRYNAAVPSSANQGRRTTILGCGVIHPIEATLLAMDPEWLWWFKLTPAGELHLDDVNTWYHHNPGEANLWRWPQSMEDALKKKVGAPASSALRTLEILTVMPVHHVTTYGLTFWGMDSDLQGREVSWQTRRQHHPSHSPAKEWDYFLGMGFERRAEGHWVWNPQA